MRSSTPLAFPFIQIGTDAKIIINTNEITYIERELIEVTDDNRARYKGLITPNGEAYVIRILLKNDRSYTYKCITEEYQTDLFDKLSMALQSHVIELPTGLQEIIRAGQINPSREVS